MLWDQRIKWKHGILLSAKSAADYETERLEKFLNVRGPAISHSNTPNGPNFNEKLNVSGEHEKGNDIRRIVRKRSYVFQRIARC